MYVLIAMHTFLHIMMGLLPTEYINWIDLEMTRNLLLN